MAEVATQDAERVLAMWDWMFESRGQLLSVGAFGDLFLSGVRDEVLMLDLLEGNITEVASSREEFAQRLRDPAARDELLLEGFVMSLRARGMVLRAGQCYGFVVSPILGGAVALENVAVMDLVPYELIVAETHRRVRGLPANTVVDGLTVDGRVPPQR